MAMVVMGNKSETSKGIKRLHNYLYDMQESNYELLEIYEEIDSDMIKLEDENYNVSTDAGEMEEERDEMKKDIKALLGRIKRWKKLDADKQEILIEELERIIF
jgi:hypothetical protein